MAISFTPSTYTHVSSRSLDVFFAHASEFGFFLDIDPIYRTCILPANFGSHSKPSPGLLWAMYLWGAHLSPEQNNPAREHEYMLRALADTATNLSTDHPQRYMQTIQAEILLSYYFWRIGRCLEAKYHAQGAASLALGCGLNKTMSANPSTLPDISVGSHGLIVLPDAYDETEQGERINGFWATVMLCKNLAVTLEQPTSVCGSFEAPGLQIDTPWPLDMESYKEVRFPVVFFRVIANVPSG